MVSVTEAAALKLQELLAASPADGEPGLRVGVRGGGCSGFQYELALDAAREDDHVFRAAGVRVIVDAGSLRFVNGAVVDYRESFQGSGFHVDNPNVVASCGCGSSFHVAEQDRPAVA